MIFYDFVGGLGSLSSSIRLMASLYRGTTAFGHPAGLHASATVSDPALGIVAIIGAKQPILPYVKRMLCFLLLNMLTSEIIAFFSKMICPDSCIHHLIPEKWDESILSRLRNPWQYCIPLARSERFKRSFVLYALHSFPTDISEDFCDDFIDS